MNDNSLAVGKSRVGLLIDGLHETPRVAVKLERSSERVEVTIPFLDGNADPYSYWFSSGIAYSDDPERRKRRYEPPRTVSFHDAYGPVALVGSRVVGAKFVLGGTGIGEGRLSFDYSVLGATDGAAYDSINGLRSEVEGLGTWIGLRALTDAHEVDEDGRLQSVNLRLRSTPAIRVSRRLNAEFQSNWRYSPGPGPDETTISERMQICTERVIALSWEEHLDAHFALRNLLRVAAWRNLNFVGHEVMSTLDPLRSADGSARGKRWLPVVTHRTGVSSVVPSGLHPADYLFKFSDIGPRGVGRWLKISRELVRGVSPLVGLLELEGASIEAHLAQVGIGFETLGYESLVSAGNSRNAAGNTTFENRVRAVTGDLAPVLPFSVEDFVDRLRRVYRAVKHADNARPDFDEMLLAYRESIQVFRCWVAESLGVPRSVLKRALEHDRVTRLIQAAQ